MQEEILNDFEINEGGLLPKKSRQLLIILSLIIAITDIIIITFYSPIVQEKTNSLFDSKMKTTVFISIFLIVLVPVASLLLSFLVSIIPIRRKKYSQKYPSIAIVIMTIAQAVFLILTLFDK